MIKLLIFGSLGCEVCNSVIEKIEKWNDNHESIPFEYFDMETVEGLSEGAYWSVYEVPTIIVVKSDKETDRWIKPISIYEKLESLSE